MNLSNYKIATKIGAGFATIVALVIGLGATALTEVDAVSAGEEQLATNNLPSVEMTAQLGSLVNSIRRQEARHVLSGDAKEMDLRESEITEDRKKLVELEPTAAALFNSEFEIKKWTSYKTHRDEWLTEWEKLRPLSRNSGESAAAAEVAAKEFGGKSHEKFLVLHQFHWDFSLAAGQSSDSIFPA